MEKAIKSKHVKKDSYKQQRHNGRKRAKKKENRLTGISSGNGKAKQTAKLET